MPGRKRFTRSLILLSCSLLLSILGLFTRPAPHLQEREPRGVVSSIGSQPAITNTWIGRSVFEIADEISAIRLKGVSISFPVVPATYRMGAYICVSDYSPNIVFQLKWHRDALGVQRIISVNAATISESAWCLVARSGKHNNVVNGHDCDDWLASMLSATSSASPVCDRIRRECASEEDIEAVLNPIAVAKSFMSPLAYFVDYQQAAATDAVVRVSFCRNANGGLHIVSAKICPIHKAAQMQPIESFRAERDLVRIIVGLGMVRNDIEARLKPIKSCRLWSTRKCTCYGYFPARFPGKCVIVYYSPDEQVFDSVSRFDVFSGVDLPDQGVDPNLRIMPDAEPLAFCQFSMMPL